ncbi:cation:proton antiporter [Tellurirhabdus rosea]|uniref:cation:proton antiporter n=1 Tax=Tellurirhabdus rosea TaxID=2674997 RepID=UPI00225C296A|nr:cation:proton antiporter [Tellurirhabdus rosea]
MTHLPPLIRDLALILGAAALTTLLFKWLRQPVVLGYILAGLLVGPNLPLFPTITDQETIRVWADIGVIVLLFNLGLEFSLKKLAKVGGVASLTGLVEISGMLLLGYLSGQLLGWSLLDSLFLGGIVAISSTTIIFRAFDELGIKTQQFASLVFGLLVVEDLVAILLLVLLSTVAVSHQFFSVEMATAVVKLVFFLVIWFVGGIFLVPSLLGAVRRFMNDETLLVVSLALCLGMVLLVTGAGFSPALGAFMMGSILAETLYVERIEKLLHPIRDLFGAVFFVSVGMLINPTMLVQYAGPIALLTFVVIVGKAFFVTLGALLAGQPLKNSLQTGLSMTQIGEFSFIIATLGLTLKVTAPFLYPIAVAVSALTSFTTPYLIRAALPLYSWLYAQLGKRTQFLLNRYSADAQSLSTTSAWRQFFRSLIQTMLINGVFSVGILMLTWRGLLPFLLRTYGDEGWVRPAVGLLALVALMPFLWALVIKPVKPVPLVPANFHPNAYRGPLRVLSISRVMVGLMLLAVYANLFFSLTALLEILAVLLLLYWGIGKRLPIFYGWVEQRFLLNLHARERNLQARPGGSLRPWDAHLAYVEVAPESPVAGKTLAELALRERHGINIVSIERGRLTKLVPTRQDQLLPGDRLAVIGTDEQLVEFRSSLEVREPLGEHPDPEVSLKRFRVEESFELIGQSIRQSGLRERTQGLVVGIERQGKRYLNPESDWVFQAGDLVWLAGNTRLIRQYIEASKLAG